MVNFWGIPWVLPAYTQILGTTAWGQSMPQLLSTAEFLVVFFHVLDFPLFFEFLLIILVILHDLGTCTALSAWLGAYFLPEVMTCAICAGP